MPQGKAVIGQSGGPTAVINKSLVGFIKEATKSNFDEIRSDFRGKFQKMKRIK